MFNVQASWFPYKIPPTPSATSDEFYALSTKAGANPNTNPSKFLEWKKIPKGSLPDGAVARLFNLCENGTPASYWMLTWDEEPTIPDPEENPTET